MSNYVIPEELFARHPAFTVNSFTNVNSDILYYAAREVEANLAKSFTIPFSGDHPTVKDLVLDAAWVRFNRITEPKIGEKLQKHLKDRFDRINNGDEYIITGSGTFLGRSVSAHDEKIPESTSENYEPVHTMLGAEHSDTKIDPDLIDDLENLRDDF